MATSGALPPQTLLINLFLVSSCIWTGCTQSTPQGTTAYEPAPEGSAPSSEDAGLWDGAEQAPDTGGDLVDAGLEDVPGDLGADLNQTDVEDVEDVEGVEDVEDVEDSGTPSFDPVSIPEATFLWPMGVASGAMTSDSFLVWGYTEDVSDWTLMVWRSVDGQAQIVHEETVETGRDGYIKVRVRGLDAGVWYTYAFFLGDEDRGLSARSEIGEVRTALGPESMEVLTLGASTCTNTPYAPFESMIETAAQDIDLFVHLGDMSYNDSANDLGAYRDKWRETLEDPGYRAILSAAGLYMTWDDHEITNNWDPERIDEQRLRDAKQAYFETLPVERFEDDRLWTSYRWGQTAEIFVLDGRSERRPSTINDDAPIYISPEQMNWLQGGLINSESHFKILLNSVPITRMPPLWLSADDRWQGYGAQRQELIDFIIDNDIHNVFFLTGDFHTGFVSHVEPEGEGRRIWEVAVGPGGNGPNPLAILADTGMLGRELVFPSSQFLYGSSLMEVMTTLTFDPVENNVRVRFVDALTFEVRFDQVISEDD